MRATIFALLFAFETWGNVFSSFTPEASGISRGLANIEITRVKKRSTDLFDSYNARISGLGESVELNLQSPNSSVFSPLFQYLEASTDPENLEFRLDDSTPTQDELKSIEQNFYTDVPSNAAVSLKRGANDDMPFTINGHIDSISIIHNNDKGLHELIRKGFETDLVNDYIDLGFSFRPAMQAMKITSATPEVFVVFDHANSQVFKHNRNRILEYLGIFFHAVNNRYATASDPKISFKISGVVAVKSLSAQPFMETAKITGGYDINKVLENLLTWAYANNKGTPTYDVVTLISGAEMQAKDSKGKYTTGVSGLAYRGAACRNTPGERKFWGASVSEDKGAFYTGVFTVAHELAHNLGAPHDGQHSAQACSWNDGHIMSYAGWGTKNKFYFSRCSLRLMKAFIDSPEGSCTKRQDSKTRDIIPISKVNAGQKLSMRQLCVKHTKSPQAVPDPKTSASDQCKNLKCKHPVPNKRGSFWISTFRPPGDESPCGNGGKCVNGDCVKTSG